MGHPLQSDTKRRAMRGGFILISSVCLIAALFGLGSAQMTAWIPFLISLGVVTRLIAYFVPDRLLPRIFPLRG